MDRVTPEERTPEEVSEGVFLSSLAAGERASMKFWRIEPGATLPTHRHHNEQIGFVVSGTLVALADGNEWQLDAGDSYFFESDELHGAENRGEEPAVGIGILSPPRNGPQWRTKAGTSNDPAVDTDGF